MHYFIVRVNTTDHNTLPLAMADMAAIIDRNGYWKKSSRPHMPIGSSLIAMGGHGGQGLFLHGIVSGNWGTVKGGAEGNPVYNHKLPVQWEATVYKHSTLGVSAALSLANLGGLRGHSKLSQERYRSVLSFVLSGEAVSPWDYETAAA